MLYQQSVRWICYSSPWCVLTRVSLSSGPGEQGDGVTLAASEEQKKQDLFKVNGFNALASDKISLDRALKDIRHPK